MKALASKEAKITVDRASYEGLLRLAVKNLAMTLIPLAGRLIAAASQSKADPTSPAFMAAYSIYFTINDLWGMVILTARELAKEEPKYKTALPLLGLDANPDVGNTKDPLNDFDIRIQQWRINLHKFVRAIDPDSPVLNTHFSFDVDPPSGR